MNVTDEDREALAVLLRNELRADSDGFGSCDLGASMADAILASDVFARIAAEIRTGSDHV